MESLSTLPETAFFPETIQKIEKAYSQKQHTPLTLLMEKAGLALFNLIKQHAPNSQHWLVLCGAGNNGGDGYIVARLAKVHGIQVTLIGCESEHTSPFEAQYAKQTWLNLQGEIRSPNDDWPEDIDVIVDALLGIGLKQAPRAPYDQLIQRANHHSAPIFSMDIPSGLCALTGHLWQHAIIAQHTLTVVGLKSGLLTGKARDHVGILHYCDLDLTPFLDNYRADIMRYDANSLPQWLFPRARCSHKGDFGKLLIIGGDIGFGGAIRLCTEAALRSGAGLVKVLTQQAHINALLTTCPEAMSQPYCLDILTQSLTWADAVIVGPGLGTQTWGREIIDQLKNLDKPMLWDADALNLLAQQPIIHRQRIITPHPGEAARLLNCSIDDIERDRFLAVKALSQKYGGVAVLKGAGTLISDGEQTVIADVGNPGMATGGMGYTLSGIIGCLLGQKLDLLDCAVLGTLIHGISADNVAKTQGEKGLLARDIIQQLPHVVNL